MKSESIQDLRDWLNVIDEAGELTRVQGADWNLEIGAISRLNYRQPEPKALLFDRIPGYKAGFRVLTGSVSNARRMALSMRLSDEIRSNHQLVEAIRGKPGEWARDASRYEPVSVNDAPVFENIIEGDATDLRMFPAPLWNELDGGRFIGTGCMVLTSDPDSGVVNGGAYRLQLQDEGRTFTVNAAPGKHGAQNIRRWLQRGERVPLTVSLGHDPLLLMLAGTEVPTGVSELNYAGAVIGRPIEVVTSDVTGLPIPASSEIVVEGWLNPERRYQEGPFAEWTGHYSGSDSPVWSLDVARVLYRDNPILLGSPTGKPPHDYSYMRTALKSAMIQDAVVGAGVPGVTGLWAHEQGGGRMLIVVAIEQRYCGHARQAAYIAAQCQQAAYMNRFVIVVDDDVDPTSLDDVVWAMCTRCDPATDIEVMKRTWGSQADPLIAADEPPYNSRAIIDACRPFERMDDYPTLAEMSPSLANRVAAKWARDLGFESLGGSSYRPDGETKTSPMQEG